MALICREQSERDEFFRIYAEAMEWYRPVAEILAIVEAARVTDSGETPRWR